MSHAGMRCACPTLFAALFGVATQAQSWVIRDPMPTLSSGLTWDASRERAVLVAELGQRLYVHEWDGIRWTPRTPSAGPAPTPNTNHGYLLAHDPTHRRVVMLGDGQQLAWGWDGVAWSQLPPPPFVPRWTAITHDAALDRMVVVNASATQGVNTTWHFDGATWTQVAANAPLGDLLLGLVHDPVRGRTVLRAGNTTFEWNVTGWVGGVTTVVPTTGVPLLFDTQRGKVVSPSAGTTMWEWTGGAWVPFATPSAGLGIYRVGKFCYDTARQATTVCDDWTGTTQRLEGGAWVVAERLPRTGVVWQTTADHTRGRIVVAETPAVFNPTPPANTLQWTPAGWQSLGTLGLPARASAAQADRDLAGVVYRFGGLDATLTANTDELWAFDGTAWTQVMAPNAPSARRQGALAVDVARQRLVAFGGYGTFWMNDTREFDGVQWHPRFPAHAPSPRQGHVMCGSTALGRVFLFGGSTAPSGAQSLEFWSWDGTDWTLLPSPPIGALSYFGLAEYQEAGTVVLTGSGPFGIDITWSWNGTVWTRLPDGPFGLQQLVAVPRLGAVLAPRTGSLLTAQPGVAASFGSGCAGSAGIPALRAFGLPSLGNGSYALDLTTMLPGPTPALVTFGFTAATTPLPGGCTLLVDPVAVQFVLAANGFVAARLAIPDELPLRGVAILAQGLVLDPAASAGYAATGGVITTIGN